MSPAEKLAKTTKRKRAARNQANARLGIHRCIAREYREDLRITLNAAAKGIGVSQSALSVIERGSDVTLSTMKKLAAFYGASFEVLWPQG